MKTGLSSFRIAIAVVALLAANGCSDEVIQPSGPPPYPVCMDASAQLNLWEGMPRTLPVRLFQLSTLEGFARAEVSKLFESQVDLPGIEGGFIDRQVHPGGRLTIELRRNPSARYIGVVAGYFHLNSNGSAKYYRSLPADPYDLDGAECIQLGPNTIEAR